MKETTSQARAVPPAWYVSGRVSPPTTSSPYSGNIVCPIHPMTIVAAHAANVNPTIHGLRLPRASEIAPRRGMESATSADETPFATAYDVFDAPRSEISHTEK